MSDSRNVFLSGGGPWGVKLTGGKDFCSPLVVSKVTAGSKAALGGAKDGDYILMINDMPTDDLKHHDAQSMIRNTGQSLRLTLTSVAPKRAAVAVETPTTTIAPITRPAPPRAPPTTTSTAPPNTTPTASPITTPTSPKTSVQVNKPPPKVVHTTGGVTINVQKQKPSSPKSTNQQSSNVASPPSRPAPPPSRPTPPVAMPTPATNQQSSNVAPPLSRPAPPPSRPMPPVAMPTPATNQQSSNVAPPLSRPAPPPSRPMPPVAMPTPATNQQSSNVAPPLSRPAPPPSRPTPPVAMPTPLSTVVTPPVNRTTPIQSPRQPNNDSGVITDSILTDDTDLNLSAESTLQSPAFRRITIDDDQPHPSIISPPSTVIKPPVMSPAYHTPPTPSATVTKGILKSPTKPPPSASVKPPAPKPTTVAGINRPAPPPVTVVKAPPTTSSGVSGGHGSKKEYERQAECAKCNDPIRGPYATAMNSNWHPDCFRCSACSKTLSNTTFVIEGNDVYCEQCYSQSVAPICEGCQQAITGNYMTAVGRYWHGEHFICCQCQTKLSSGGEGGEGGFHYDEGRLYCPNCFSAIFGVQCFGCKQLVGGNELWVEAMDQNWHPQCFVCLACRNPLEGQSFFVKAGNPYCGKCK